MFAAFLEANRDQLLGSVEPRAATEEPLVVPAERRARLEGLLEELIQALRDGGTGRSEGTTVALGCDAAVGRRDRELLRREVVELTEQRGVQATLREMGIVSDWAWSADREGLREHNRRLAVLLDGVDEAVALFSADGRLLYVNREGARVLHEVTGVSPDEIVGRTGAELAAPPELAVGLSPDELVAKALADASEQTNLLGRWRERRLGAIYGPDGRLGAVTLVSRDIQEPKLAFIRTQLLSKLSLLVGSVDYGDVAEAIARVPIPELADWCAVHIMEGAKTVNTFVAQRNPGQSALQDALTQELSSWTGHPLWRERLPSGFQLLTEVNDSLIRGFATSEAQYRLLADVGMRSLMVVPVVTRGVIAGVVTLIYTEQSGRRYGRDDPALAEELALRAAHIVENARLLKELKASEARFRVALGGARTTVYEQDNSLRFVWFHDSARRPNLVGKRHEDAYPPEEAAQLNALKERVLQSGKSVHEEIALMVAGERRHLREAVDPVRDHAGRVVGVIGAATDITEEKRVQHELRDALAFRDKMAGILTHDLRNPLGAVTMVADAVQRRSDPAPAWLQQKMTVIKSAAGRMTEMINTLLDFTLVHATGKLPVAMVLIDLATVVREATHEARAGNPDRAIEVDMRGDLRGEWDPARMAQALSNLIGNAMSYGDPRTPVRVLADGDDSDVSLRVKNDGPQISPELIPVFFEPFQRGPRGTSPHHLGLGLYIVKQIVLAHRGTVDVDSSAESGTTFKMSLPRTRSPA